jgi:hypothetical protein
MKRQQLTVLALLLLLSTHAGATQNVMPLGGTVGEVCVKIVNYKGEPTNAPFWTVDFMGGVHQKGGLNGTGCVSVNDTDTVLRAGARDDDLITIIRKDLTAPPRLPDDSGAVMREPS